jgi:NodT family efflux transporter outer membrane factor (OMF) lipoprotein
MKRVKEDREILVKPRPWSIAGLICIIILLGACGKSPKYRKPAVPVPGSYKEQVPSTYKAMAGWKMARPGDDTIRERWWEVFNDSQLNSLEELVNISNQNIAIAEAQFRQARALVRANRSAYYPIITTSPSITRLHSSTGSSNSQFTSASTINDYLLPVDFSYEADVWGRVRSSVEASRASAQASAADMETIRLSIHAELATDYFQLRSFDALKQLLDTTVAAFEKALQLTTNRYKGGIASAADVAQAETQLETTRAQAIDTGVARAQLEHAIALLVGAPASTFSIPALSATPLPPEVPVGIPSELLERRPDIAGAERRVASANAQIGVAKAAFFPTLTLSGSFGFQSSRIASWLSWPSRLWSIGPALAQTLFDGGERRALSDEARAAYDASVASYRQTVLTAFQEVEDNLAAARILTDEAERQDAAVKAADRSLTISLNQYRGGIATYLQVITAQTAALTNQQVALSIWQRRMLASVLLIKALGGGWDASKLPTSRDLTHY